MRRLPLRYLLAALGLCLTGLLFFAGQQQRQRLEKAGWSMANWDGPPPRPTEIAQAFSVPAEIAALPGFLLLAAALHATSDITRLGRYDALLEIYLGVFVFGQWFLIGRWVDRRRGLLPPPASKLPANFSCFLYVAAILGSLSFVCFGVFLMVHSGWMSTWIPGAGVTAWSLIATALLVPPLFRSFRAHNR